MNKFSGLNLGDLEIMTLECLWGSGENDVKGVHAEISAEHKVTSNTVQSTLDRLHRKGLLTRRKVSHAFFYTPAVDRAGLLGRAINAAITQLNCGGTGAELTAFVDFASRSDQATLRQLERLVADRIRANEQ
jgi:predicted transcriptional regulator